MIYSQMQTLTSSASTIQSIAASLLPRSESSKDVRNGFFYLARPATELQQQHGGLCVLLLFLIFNDFCHTSYLNVYWTHLSQMWL